MEGKALAGEGAPGWEECPEKLTVSFCMEWPGIIHLVYGIAWKQSIWNGLESLRNFFFDKNVLERGHNLVCTVWKKT